MFNVKLKDHISREQKVAFVGKLHQEVAVAWYIR